MDPAPADLTEPPRPITIADVAERAGVAPSTVSRVLNDHASVRPATRRRVMAVVEELDYSPSEIARSLSRRKTGTVGVLVPFFTHPSAVERLRGLTRALTARGYYVVLFDVETRAQRDAQLRTLAQAGRTDAAIVVSLPVTDEEVARFKRSRLPLILLDTASAAAPHIVIDDVRGGRLAAEHLLGLGHRRIAFVGDPPSNPFAFTSSIDRRTGYFHALEAGGVPIRPELIREGEHDQDVASRLTGELLALPEWPTGVVVASDTQALGVLDACRRHGVAVPQELSVIGFDDISVSRLVGLTTVRQPLEESGRRAAELLLGLLEDDEQVPLRTLLPLELVFRDTTAPPATT
jgi:DNA-binding LacI/PurR family transcriptional regulator